MLRRGCPKRPRYIILRFFAQPPLFFGCTWTRAMSGGFFYSDAWHGTLENGRHGEKKNEGTVGLILITGSRRKCHPLLLAGREKKRLGGWGDGMPPARLKKRHPWCCFSVGGYFLEDIFWRVLERWEKKGPWESRPFNGRSSISPAHSGSI